MTYELTEAELEEYELRRDENHSSMTKMFRDFRFEVWYIEMIADKFRAKEKVGIPSPFHYRFVTFGRGIDNNESVVYLASKFIKYCREELENIRAEIKENSMKWAETKDDFFSLKVQMLNIFKEEVVEAQTRFMKYKKRGMGKITSEWEIKSEDMKSVPIGDILVDHGVGGYGRKMFKCPLHAEDTPSFVWYVQQNTWWCFGACNTGGDVIDLYMKMHKCDFKSALQSLKLYV